MLGPLTTWDSVIGHFPRAVTTPSLSAGADLKEREQMSEAEVGIFVQRLRGLMNEIGEGLGVGWRRAFRGPADPSPNTPTILHCKERTVSVVSSVKTDDSPRRKGTKNSTRWKGTREFRGHFSRRELWCSAFVSC